jgi:hypothetical protein
VEFPLPWFTPRNLRTKLWSELSGFLSVLPGDLDLRGALGGNGWVIDELVSRLVLLRCSPCHLLSHSSGFWASGTGESGMNMSLPPLSKQ